MIASSVTVLLAMMKIRVIQVSFKVKANILLLERKIFEVFINLESTHTFWCSTEKDFNLLILSSHIEKWDCIANGRADLIL